MKSSVSELGMRRVYLHYFVAFSTSIQQALVFFNRQVTVLGSRMLHNDLVWRMF